MARESIFGISHDERLSPSDLDIGQKFIILSDRAVILLSAFMAVHPLQDLLLAADHKGKGSVNSLGLAAGNGSIEHLNALLCQLCGNFLTCNRVDGAHVDKDLALFHITRNAVCTQHNSLDVRGVGKHGQNDVAGLADLLVCGLLSTAGDDIIYCRLIQITYEQICIAALIAAAQACLNISVVIQFRAAKVSISLKLGWITRQG